MALNVSSLNFNGTNRYAKLSTNASLKNMENFTWMAWIKVGPLSRSLLQRAYVERQGTGTGIRFACTPVRGRLRFELSIKDGRTDTNYDYLYTWDDRWHHVAFVARVSGTNPSYTIFIDSTEVAEGTLVRPSGQEIISNTAPLGSIYLGNHSLHTTGGETFPSDRYWQGGIDEILIFNTAKNQDDILGYYTSDDTWSMGDGEMFSYWQFDANTGTTTADSDNGGWTGTLYESGVASSALWQIDRPFLGNGTVDTTIPTTPTLPATPTFNITADGFTADWNLTTDNVFVQSYELQVAQVSDFSSYVSHTLEDQDTSIISGKILTGLLPGTNYYWRVRAFDAALNPSGYTTAQSLTTLGTGDLVAPVPPTNVTATSITHSGFTINWTASASSDETGYKIDVAFDPTFTNYLSEFRNRGTGNVTSTVVSGTLPLTTYYVRLRAHDAAGNESASTTTLVVTTPSQPDVIPPSEVLLGSPSSIASRAFTANWEEGFDNVGIDHYLLDVATDSLFASPVVNVFGTWSAKDVGNVTEYRVEDLSPETTYYYRVRAADIAGNISENQAEPVAVETTPPTIEEGGFLTTIVEPQADAWTNSAATSVNNGTATTLDVLGNGTINTRAAFLQFDLSTVVGAIQSATLFLYVTEASAGIIKVAADNVTFDELTITWANQPTVSGLDLNISPTLVNQWVSVDISSLLLDGATTYAVKVFTTSTDGASFSSKEGTNRPYIELEHDPSTATNVIDLTVESEDGTFVNYKTNPSFESNATTNWQTASSATIAINSTDAVGGTRCVEVTATAALAGLQSNPFSIAAAVDQQWAAGLYVKHVSGTAGLRINLQEYIAGGIVAETTFDVTAPPVGEWRRYDLSRLLTNAGTTHVGVRVLSLNGACVFRVDNVILARSKHAPAYFDGDTFGAAWSGTVKASTSVFGLAQITSESTYIGDSDNDNSVVPYLKRSNEFDWIYLPGFPVDVTHNRSTKRVSAVLGHSYTSYNMILNPSMELNAANWTAVVSGGTPTLAHTTSDAYFGLGCLMVTAPANIGVGVRSNLTPALAGQSWGARVHVKAPIGLGIQLKIQAHNTAGTVIATSVSDFGGSSGSLYGSAVYGDAPFIAGGLVGTGTWEALAGLFTLPANTAYVSLSVVTSSAEGGIFYVDTAYLGQGSAYGVNPYRDGTMDDGIWEGVPHASATGLRLLPTTSYDVLHEYTDPDGLYENTGTTTASVTATYTTAAIADNVTTAGLLVLTPSLTGITAVLDYTGDDNENLAPRILYKRTDLSTWYEIPVMHHKDHKHIHGEITNLSLGTSYTVKIVLTDPDGTYNTVNDEVTGVTTTLTNRETGESVSRIMFGGFVLFDGANQTSNYGVISHNAYGFPNRRVQVEDLPLVDGAVELSNIWGRREIRMRGFVAGNTRGELDENLRALKSALTPRLQRLVIDTLGTFGRYFNATCETFDVEQEGERNNTHVLWDATFVCADPFAYDPVVDMLPETTVTNGSTFSVNNGGNLKIDVDIHLRTTHTFPVTITVVNNTTGERITPQTTIISGDRLEIDAKTYSIKKNGIDVNYAGSFIRLNPGSNQFSFILATTSGTASALVDMHWQHKHL